MEPRSNSARLGRRHGRRLIPLCTRTQANARPAAFHLAQNFPNPFNQSTVFRIDLETRAEVELAVYNIAGQKVATLAQGPYPSGAYTFTWDGRNYPRG